MNFTKKMLRVAWLSMLVAFIAIFISTCSADAASPKKKHQATGCECREQVMNDTLNWTLAIGAAWRAQGRKYTWDELQFAVAAQMKIKRKTPWK